MNKPNRNTAPTASKRYYIPIYTVALVREGNLSQLERPPLTSSRLAADVLMAYLADADREHLVVLLLNSKNRLLGINTVSIGSLSSSLAHPREVFKPAILANAAAVILGHNHPSGDPTPSAEDLALTRRFKEAAELLGIRLLDHIIVGENGRWYSCVDEGALA
ncbi:MAG: JAB domain-containing protein [Candidatus Binatia bacterium]